MSTICLPSLCASILRRDLLPILLNFANVEVSRGDACLAAFRSRFNLDAKALPDARYNDAAAFYDVPFEDTASRVVPAHLTLAHQFRTPPALCGSL
jgi:hypothetical protein